MDYTKILHAYRPMTNRELCGDCRLEASAAVHDQAKLAAKIERARAKAAISTTPVSVKQLPGHCRKCGAYIGYDRDTRDAHRSGWACYESI